MVGMVRGKENRVRTLVRIMAVVALAFTVTACDKCGNWFKYTPVKACDSSPVGR